jgi:hypothetical protein
MRSGLLPGTEESCTDPFDDVDRLLPTVRTVAERESRVEAWLRRAERWLATSIAGPVALDRTGTRGRDLLDGKLTLPQREADRRPIVISQACDHAGAPNGWHVMQIVVPSGRSPRTRRAARSAAQRHGGCLVLQRRL